MKTYPSREHNINTINKAIKSLEKALKHTGHANDSFYRMAGNHSIQLGEETLEAYKAINR